MPPLRYSARASHDLKRLHQFLAEFDERTAIRAIDAIHGSLSQLRIAPNIGRPVNEVLREWLIDFGSSGYLALYEHDEVRDVLVVHAVRHQKERDYPAVFEPQPPRKIK